MKLVVDIPEEIYEALRKTDVIISGQRSGKSLMSVVFNAVAKSTPLDHVFNTIKGGIKEEAGYAYADFEQYKADVLNAEADELPDDDFRYGMERAIEIIDVYRKVVSE